MVVDLKGQYGGWRGGVDGTNRTHETYVCIAWNQALEVAMLRLDITVLMRARSDTFHLSPGFQKHGVDK